MGREIERRFLLRDARWRDGAPRRRLRQGFLRLDAACTIRVRVIDNDAWLTIKAERDAVCRAEFEYPLALADAEQMLAYQCLFRVDKWRYRVEYSGWQWEIDEYDAGNAGLVLAEIELPTEQTPFARPPWLGDEVTHDPRYRYAWLSRHPYVGWP